MEYLRLLVELAPDAVAAEFAHDGEAVALGMALNRRADVAQMRPRCNRADAAPHRLVAGLAQVLRMGGRLADEVHPARVAVKAVPNDRDVDVKNVAGL